MILEYLSEYYAKQLVIVAKRQLREIAADEGCKVANAVESEFSRKLNSEAETDPIQVPQGWDRV